MARRMPGDGSVYKRTRTRPDGKAYVRWIAQVSYGPRDARRVVRRVRRTRAEAVAALAELTAPRESRQPLGDYLRSWLHETAAPSLAPNTVRGYAAVIRSARPLHEIPLGELTAEDVEGWLNRLRAQRHGQEVAVAASPKTRRNALAMLRGALGSAVRRGYLVRNVAELVAMPRVARRSRVAMTPVVARAILDATKDDRYAAAYALALCGLRVGEVLGLAWEDVDGDVVVIRQQLQGSGKRARLVPTKTAGSAAPVPIPPFVVARLAQHRALQLEERIKAGRPTSDGLVFVTERGYAVSGSWLTKHFGDLCEAAGLARGNLHALRHGAAALLAQAGVHPRVAQALLRHSTVRMTMETYTAVSATQEREAADMLEEMLG